MSVNTFYAGICWLSSAAAVDLIPNSGPGQLAPGLYEVQVYHTAPNSETIFLGGPNLSAGGGTPNSAGDGFVLVPNKLYSFNVVVSESSGGSYYSTCYATSSQGPIDDENPSPLYVMLYPKN